MLMKFLRLNRFLLRPSKFHVSDFIVQVEGVVVEVEVSGVLEGDDAPTVKVRLSETSSLTGLVLWMLGALMTKMSSFQSGRKMLLVFDSQDFGWELPGQILQLKLEKCHWNEYLHRLQHQGCCCLFHYLFVDL